MFTMKSLVRGISAGIATGGNGVAVDASSSAAKPEGMRDLGDAISRERGFLSGWNFDEDKKDGKRGRFGV